jgi:hypothetical protein
LLRLLAVAVVVAEAADAVAATKKNVLKAHAAAKVMVVVDAVTNRLIK